MRRAPNMMQEITDAAGKATAQQALHDALTAVLAPRGDCAIGYRGGGGTHPVWSNGSGQLYYSYAPPYPDQAIRRHWNAFGFFATSGQQRIVVETNIPSKAGEKRAEGFFARDPVSGATLLMHRGRMGGRGGGACRAPPGLLSRRGAPSPPSSGAVTAKAVSG